jgi:nicotinamidase-related amidase
VKHPSVLAAGRTCLVVVDVQERFRGVQKGFEQMLLGVVRLVSTFRILELPVLVTEQYPQGLGRSVPELLGALGENDAFTKTSFSACGSAAFCRRLTDLGRRQVLVCGIETHVCVSQTVHDLLARGYCVHVAVDAVESREAADRELALRKMERSGAILTTSEAAAFELLGGKDSPGFKAVQALFK